ncbi:MAG TPA: NUDIX hydrolase [Alphaproteobacteria bacterium]|nr:NUDIX hydrolase [Alphaproteobacteria bacterium]
MPKTPREYPDYPIAGVGVVVWKDGNVLLIRRGRPPREGEWSLPGGRQKLGETTRQTAIREVREEAGIEIVVGHLLDVIDSIIPDSDGRIHYHYTLADFDAEWQAGEAQSGGDAAAIEWTDPADLARYDLWDETVRIIALSAELRETLA